MYYWEEVYRGQDYRHNRERERGAGDNNLYFGRNDMFIRRLQLLLRECLLSKLLFTFVRANFNLGDK